MRNVRPLPIGRERELANVMSPQVHFVQRFKRFRVYYATIAGKRIAHYKLLLVRREPHVPGLLSGIGAGSDLLRLKIDDRHGILALQRYKRSPTVVRKSDS